MWHLHIIDPALIIKIIIGVIDICSSVQNYKLKFKKIIMNNTTEKPS
jgi:hypothetical protein